MKKIISLFLAMLMTFSLFSCADNSIDPPETTGNGPEVTTQPETTEAPVGEYVLRHKFADIDEVLERPEIETDISRLRDFYTVTKSTISFRGMETASEMVISVKGYGADRTEMIFKQESSSDIRNAMQVGVSACAVIVLDNVNKTHKVYEAYSMNSDISEDIEGGDDVEDSMNGIVGSLLSGNYNDASDKYTYETAKNEIDNCLGMYTGIGFFEFMQKNYPDVKFTKRPDEGNCYVYKAQIDDNKVRFKFDRETGLFDHASYTGREHFEVTEYSFTECLHTDSDIPDIAK